MASTMEIYNQGLSALLEKLGVVETEQFIAVVKRENFDYTKWQREYFDSFSDGEFMRKAEEYSETHPYAGNGKVI